MLPNFLCSVSTPCRSAVDFDTVSITDSLSQHQRRKALRRELRQRRRALSPLQRRQAANALGKRLRGLP
ncbi:hypothetical protein BIS06_17965, partial [Halomonas sp. BBD48]|nr:hypothetical protein [Halomonas sp. BBD48]